MILLIFIFIFTSLSASIRTLQLSEKMNEQIPHECGVALVRLKKPLSYYWDTYSDVAWGLHKLYLMMEKQRNRGQDGAGIAVGKLQMPAGKKYIERRRSVAHNPIETVFNQASQDLTNKRELFMHCWSSRLSKEHHKFLGEVYIGHLRYGTYGNDDVSCCQPYLCKNSIEIKNLVIAGNFNLTNTQELFSQLIHDGVKPTCNSDTQVILERINYELNKAYQQHGDSLELHEVITAACKDWDGGFVFVGFLGNGTTFMMRDPAGIRPGFYYEDDDCFACASERVVLAHVFNVDPNEIKPIPPGHVLIIDKDGSLHNYAYANPRDHKQCTFERIYFSRGNDPAIYQERKKLGRNLAPRILERINWDVAHTVFAYIPNTSEVAFYGVIEALQEEIQKKLIAEAMQGTKTLNELSLVSLRVDKIAIKDQKFRTFIAQDKTRKHLMSYVYDVTHHVVTPEDTLVVIDDSIVRGITLRESIIRQLSRLNPKKIIVASSAPPVMYPDCYGIDMSQLGRFIAFEAAVALTHDKQNQSLLQEIMYYCDNQKNIDPEEMQNYVKKLYDQFTLEELESKIAELVNSKNLNWNGTVELLYQTIEDLHDAMPEYTGDWYFTGDYPTPGGYKVVNRSYLQWFEGNNDRAY